ncbi:MAG: hypothetical protein JWQ87_5428 [Candidatus Sulfotelmatobacter sp.]|nr:hypothetical protein [Candidatus Sulfotelmatobacter sp.]
MNKTQREAIQRAIEFEEDWLYRARREDQASNITAYADPRIAAHERTLAELKEEL